LGWSNGAATAGSGKMTADGCREKKVWSGKSRLQKENGKTSIWVEPKQSVVPPSPGGWKESVTDWHQLDPFWGGGFWRSLKKETSMEGGRDETRECRGPPARVEQKEKTERRRVEEKKGLSFPLGGRKGDGGLGNRFSGDKPLFEKGKEVKRKGK